MTFPSFRLVRGLYLLRGRVQTTRKPISIAGLSTASQTVDQGGTIKPFASAIINDDSTNAFIIVSISEDNTGNGTLIL